MFSNLLALLTPRIQAPPAGPSTIPWSRTLRLGGTPLTVRIRRVAGTDADPNPYPPTRVEVWKGARLLASGTTDLFFDPSERPYFRASSSAATLAFAANPGAGSGPYASLWRVWDGGRRLRLLGELTFANYPGATSSARSERRSTRRPTS